MKLFGEYLVQKKLISEDDLAAAVVAQVAALPSLPEVLLEHHLLDSKTLLAAMKQQMLAGTDFRRACVDLGVWSTELERKAQAVLDGRRQPLGEILVSRGAITRDQMLKALQEYFTERDQSGNPPPANEPALTQLLSTLCQPALRDRLAKRLDEFALASNLPARDELLQDIRYLRGCMRLAGAAGPERLCQEFERACLDGDGDPGQLAKAGRALLQSIWNLPGVPL